MIVEDSPDDYEACVAALTEDHNLSNPIQWCQTGDEAIDYLLRQGKFTDLETDMPSLILLDLNLPGTNGREVLQAIKTNEVLKKIPVIVMTSSRDEVDIETCYNLGANSYVVKPVNFQGFIDAIARLRDYWFQIVMLPRSE